MEILVTGSSGYVASALIPALLQAGHNVVGFDRREPRFRQIRIVQADLLDERSVAEAVQGVEMVFHLAAAKDDWGLTESEYHRDNVEATKSLIAVGRNAGIARWVHFSTVGVLGPSDVPIDESAAMNPVAAYGRTKAEAERMFVDFASADTGIELVVLRPSAVFGPGNPPNTNVARLIEAIARGRFLMVGDGHVPKTSSYIENLIAATTFLIPRMRPGAQVFHYVDDPILETEELVNEVHTYLGKRRGRLRLPVGAAVNLAKVADWVGALTNVDLPITSARIEKFCTATSFGAATIRRAGFTQPVENGEAIRRTVEWYLSVSRARA